MTTVKNYFFIASLVGLTFFLSSNIGYESAFDTPGKIEFIGDAGSPNVFVFNKWKFTQASIPNGQVEQIKASVEINTSSLTTDWKDLESNIRKKKDYFYVKKFPKATIEIDGATPTADGQYTTEAMLNLKGIRKPVTLTFTITDQAPYRVVGQGVIERKIFNFKGKGPKWEVPVNFDVVLPVD